MTEILNRNIAPQINQISKLIKLSPKEYTLSNGVPVYVFNNPDQELLKIELVFDAGSAYSPKPLVATAVNNMLTEVTKNYTAKKLAEEIDFYGAYFETSASRDHASVILYSLNKFINSTIPLLAEVVENASFAEKNLNSIKLERSRNLRLIMKKLVLLLVNNLHHYCLVKIIPMVVMLKLKIMIF